MVSARRAPGDRGVVLVNALVTILVIATISASLMVMAERSRLRTDDGLAVDQAEIYLDSMQSLIPRLLESDWSGQGPVALTQDWARPDYRFDIDRGAVSGRLADLQGRFNLTWLTGPDPGQAQAAFARLWGDLGLAPGDLAPLLEALGERAPWAAGDGPAPDSLRDIRQLMAWGLVSGAQYRVLRPHVTVLPAERRLNLNTATPPVLRAVLGGLDDAALNDLVAVRQRQPFVRVDEVKFRLAGVLDDDTLALIGFERFDIRSGWFLAELAAELDGRLLRRAVVFVRDDTDRGRTRLHAVDPLYD